MNQIEKNQCPRWDSCSANYCPIYGGNVHLRGEATCYYMREALKGVPEDLFKGDGERFAYEAANDHIAFWAAFLRSLFKALGKSSHNAMWSLAAS